MEKKEINDLSEKIKTIKEEVDALQITIMKQRSPWYKNIPTIISILALLFSFGTTIVSYKRTLDQDIQNRKGELRVILQRLAILPIDYVEYQKKYHDDQIAFGNILSSIAQENTLLVKQASTIGNWLSKRKKIDSSEYISIGVALKNCYDLAEAEKFYKNGIEFAKKTKDFNNEIAALRNYAEILFLTGRQAEGRHELENAMDIFSRYQDQSGNNIFNEYTQYFTHIKTELSWAKLESGIESSSEIIRSHINKAENYSKKLTPGPNTDQIKQEIIQTKKLLNLY